MKQEKIFSSRYFAGLLVLTSLIVSACGDAAKSEVAGTANKPVQATVDRTSNAAANTSASPLYESKDLADADR